MINFRKQVSNYKIIIFSLVNFNCLPPLSKMSKIAPDPRETLDSSNSQNLCDARPPLTPTAVGFA